MIVPRNADFGPNPLPDQVLGKFALLHRIFIIGLTPSS